MKPHFRFRRFFISCLNLVVCYTLSEAEAWAETQNLSCEATSLTWDTQSPVFADADGKAASFAAGDNVSFLGETKVTLGEDISAGCINITTGANVSINRADYELSAERITLSGTLEDGDSLSIGEGAALVVAAPSAVLKSDLILADAGTLAVGAAANLSGSSLTLQGGTDFSLSGSALTSADGRVYNIFTGVGALLGGDGSALSLSETDNAISLYFDATRPGSGFWANSTLQLTADGALNEVGLAEAVKDGVEYTSRQYGSFAHSYYKSVVFRGISHYSEGGAIYGLGYITLSNNGSVTFSGNLVDASGFANEGSGGAIYGARSCTITLSDNGSVVFEGNTGFTNTYYDSNGGAICVVENCTITLSNNGSVEFERNSAADRGGAIYASYSFAGDPAGTITLSNNGSVVFERNTAGINGGAISGGGDITLSNNGSVFFEGNSAGHDGGAIYGATAITLSNNGSVVFERNSVADSGGAIYGYGDTPITLSNNDSVSFIGNSVSGSSAAYGGAIAWGGDITLNNNDSVSFSGNSVSGSSAAYGGAIADNIIALSNNGRVSFIGNSAISNHNFSACGGAIYATYELSIRNNDTVLFEKNAEVEDGTYRLRSIYATGRGVEISLSAAAEKSIEFRDSVYVDSLSTVKLNKDYKDVDGTVHKQEGDIVFTGGYTEKNLNELLSANKENRKATKKEITNSRTSEMHGEVTLYGGRLRVEEKAVLKTTAGLTVAEDSNATVKVDNAELDAYESDITIGATGKLELSNGAIVRANSIIIDENASLALSSSEMQAYTTFVLRNEAVPAAFSSYHTDNAVVIDGNLTLNGGSTLLLDNAHICMTDSSVLTFNASDDKKINLVLTLGAVYESDVPIVLFSEVNSISFIYNDCELTAGEGVNVGDFFTGEWINEKTTFTYDAETGTIFAMNVNSLSVPEPTTATLSLLALAALAVRRRRW